MAGARQRQRAVVLGLGLTLLMLGLLRLLQTEWDERDDRPVVVVAVPDRARGRRRHCSLITVTRISKKSLNEESY